jgi:Fe-S-cluster containining protein
MSNLGQEEFLCVRCARHTRTCCQRCEIYATPGDVHRIREYTGLAEFTEFGIPKDPSYGDQDDDPLWDQHVFRADGSRRVVKRQANGDCLFLGERGCILPLETRPLICRIYPYDYTEKGIDADLAEGCPLELLRSGQGLIDALDMNLEDARRWHRQLYQEIQLEPKESTCASD